MAANERRGEVAVKLDGVEYIMRPTFEALAQIEVDLGDRLLPLVTRINRTDIGIMDVAKIIFYGITATGASLSVEKIGNCLVQDGLTDHIEEVMKFLSYGLSGAPKGNGEQAEQK